MSRYLVVLRNRKQYKVMRIKDYTDNVEAEKEAIRMASRERAVLDEVYPLGEGLMAKSVAAALKQAHTA